MTATIQTILLLLAVLVVVAVVARRLDIAPSILLVAAGIQLAWQVRTLDINDSPNCLDKFRSNRLFGWVMMIAIVAGKLL